MYTFKILLGPQLHIHETIGIKSIRLRSNIL